MAREDDMRGLGIIEGIDIATGIGECHAPPANMYDVLSRLFEAAKRLELDWISPEDRVVSAMDPSLKEPYFIIDNGNRRLDVALMADRSTSVMQIPDMKVHYDACLEIPRVTLVTPADYERAYRWLVTGE